MKLSVRLTTAFTLLGLVTVCSVAAFSWVASASEIRAAVDSRLDERAASVLRFTRTEIGTELLRTLTPSATATEPALNSGGGILFVLNDGARVGPEPFRVQPKASDRLLTGETFYFTESSVGATYRVLATPLPDLAVGQDSPMALSGAFVFDDVTSEEEAIADLRTRLALLAAGAIAAVATASWFVGRWLSRPLVMLTSAVEHVTEPNSSPPMRIEVDRSDEIGRLADRFNRMLSALEIGREQQQRLVADASHELRTPLTALRMRAEFLRSFDTLTLEQRNVVEGAVLDIVQLSALLSDLVDLASDAHTPDEPPERVALASVIGETVDRTSVATGREVLLAADDSQGVVYPSMIRRATRNLIDNATKYSPEGTPVLVRVSNGTIEVIDRGPGIAQEDLASVFDRFFRSPQARSRPGNGIGLAIVQQVAEAHGGKVFAANEPLGGARVGFTIRSVGETLTPD